MGHDWTYQTTEKARFPMYNNETYVGVIIVDEEWDRDTGEQRFHVYTIIDQERAKYRWDRLDAVFHSAHEAFQAVFNYGAWGIDVQERQHKPTPFDHVMSVLTDTWTSPEEAAYRIIDALEAQ